MRRSDDELVIRPYKATSISDLIDQSIIDDIANSSRKKLRETYEEFRAEEFRRVNKMPGPPFSFSAADFKVPFFKKEEE